MVLVIVVSVDSGPSDGGTPNMRRTSPSSKLLPCLMNLFPGGIIVGIEIRKYGFLVSLEGFTGFEYIKGFEY